MKPTFNNANAKGISKARQGIYKALFYISTFTTAICIAGIIVSMISPTANIENSPWLWAGAFVGSFVLAHIIDFQINIRLGKMVIPELVAWWTGKFQFPVLRKVGAVLIGAVWVFGVSASFITSYDGSALAAGMAPTFTPPNLQGVANEERKAVSSAIAPYKDAVTKIEGSIAGDISANTSSEIKRLVKEKNAWAIAEANKIAAYYKKAHSKDLEAAKMALAKAEEREHGRAEKIIASVENNANQINNKNEQRTGLIWKFLTAIGTLPLIFGVFLVVAECADAVQAQLPNDQPNPNNKGGASQRTGDEEHEKLDALYTNP